MRGIYTPVTKIRRQVFAAIAKMAYEGGDYASRVEEIPFEIIPGEVANYRDSVFKEKSHYRGAPASRHWPAFIPSRSAFPHLQRCGGKRHR